ncbi:hypothetical protein M1O51_00455 [Dehalococcoidia bacterium]|nr:hypothetical protein [Dehalococcoidia bacterium]
MPTGFGAVAGHGSTTGAKKKTTEEVKAGHCPGMGHHRALCCQLSLNQIEGLAIDDARPGAVHPHWRFPAVECRVSRPIAPHQSAAIRFIIENLIYRGAPPSLTAASPQALAIESRCDCLTAHILESHVKHSPHHLNSYRVIGLRLKLISGSAAITDGNFAEAVRWPAAIEEAPRGILTHPSLDVLSQVSAVELVNGLNDALEQAAGRAVIQRLIDRNDIDTFVSQQGLVGDRLSPAPGKTVQLPDQDSLEGRLLGLGKCQHFPESWSSRGAAAFGLVDKFPDHVIAISSGIVAESSKLC